MPTMEITAAQACDPDSYTGCPPSDHPTQPPHPSHPVHPSHSASPPATVTPSATSVPSTTVASTPTAGHLPTLPVTSSPVHPATVYIVLGVLLITLALSGFGLTGYYPGRRRRQRRSPKA